MASILIVDDRPTNRQFLLTLLGYGGHRLSEAADGAEALKIARAEHPDLVITDLLMPTMDGFEFVQHLREEPELAQTQVVFYTATYRAHEARLLANAVGVQYVLAKPSEPATILETVQRALGTSQPASTPSHAGVDERLGVVRLRQISEEMSRYFTDLQTASTQLYNTIERGATLAAERDYLLNIAARFSTVVGELQGLNSRLSLLNELNAEFMAERDTDKLLKLFCVAARRIMGARYAATGLLEPDEQTLSKHIFSDLDEEVVATIDGPPTQHSLLKRVIEERHLVRLRDLPTDMESSGFPSLHLPMRSFLGAPILTSTRLYGMFYVGDKIGADEFNEDDERMALTLASQMAAAYENLLLYDQIQHHAASLQVEVNERRKVEEALKLENERFQRFVESNIVGIAIVDMAGNIITANDYCLNILGATRSDLQQGKIQWRNFTPPEWLATNEKAIRELQERGVSDPYEKEYERADGTRVPVYIADAMLPGPGEQILTLVLDISERKRAEQALQAKNEEIQAMSQQLWQAAKLATMGELAASIAHELNNPLATVSLRAEMLSTQFSPDSAEVKSLQVIESELKRMSTLVANLLQFSRRGSKQVSTVDVHQEVSSTLELINYHLRKHNIRTVQELSPEIPPVHADRQQLRQVLLNLFTNAADAMPQGGTLTVRTFPSAKLTAGTTAPLRLKATASLGLPVSQLPPVVIEISDTGEGIAPENLDRVWDPFFTTKPEGKGTGLGLAICRRIVQEHGGTIEISSEGVPGKGATVRITLPAINGRS